MAVIDELVTILRFDAPASSMKALEGVQKSVSNITDKIAGLGFASAITSTIMAAWGINAAGAAKDLNSLALATGANQKEIQQLQAMYAQVGGSASDFARDAENFFNNTGQSLTIEKMKELSVEFSSMAEREAVQRGKALGLSMSMIRVLRMGPQEIQRMAEETAKYNTVSEKSLDNLTRQDTAWTKFKDDLSTLSTEFQGKVAAPVLTEMFEDMTGFLRENKDDIIDGFTAISEGVQGAWGTIKDVGASAKKELAPLWEVLDKVVKENGGWADAIKNVTLALAGISALVIPMGLIGGILSFSGAVSGLIGAGAGLAAFFGPAGLVALTLAASVIAVSSYRENIAKEVDAVQKKLEESNKTTDAFVSKYKPKQEGESFTLPTAKSVEKDFADIQAEIERITKQKTENYSTTVKDALPIIGQSTITGSIGALKKGFSRDSDLSSNLDTLNQKFDEIISMSSNEDKRWLAENAQDPRVRKKLQGLGYATENSSDTVMGMDRSNSPTLRTFQEMTKRQFIRFRGDKGAPEGAENVMDPEPDYTGNPYQRRAKLFENSFSKIGKNAQQQSVTNNFNINMDIKSTDPVQAGKEAADAIQAVQVNRPGPYSPSFSG